MREGGAGPEKGRPFSFPNTDTPRFSNSLSSFDVTTKFHTDNVTTRTIAEVSGVSHVTVSRVLRHQKGASEATRKRVLDAAKSMGYQPNPLFSMFMGQVRKRQKKRLVAAIAWLNGLQRPNEWTTVAYRKSVFEAARAQAAVLGYNLESIWMRAPGLTAKRLERILLSRGIQGVVVPPPGLRTEGSLLKEMNWDAFAVVSMDGAVGLAGWNTVRQHDGYNIRLAIDHLKSRGYRRIGLAIPLVTNQISELSLEAHYLQYTFQQPEANRLRPLIFRSANRLELLAEWIRSEAPEAIICCEEDFRGWVERLGLRVPQDIGLVHLNVNEDVPGWAGVRHDHEGMGRTLMELLSSQLQANQRGIPPYRKCVLVEGKWVEGTTIRAATSA